MSCGEDNIIGGVLSENSAENGGAIRTAFVINITGGEFIGNSGGTNKQTFNFSAATQISNVKIECVEGGSVGKNVKIVSGTVNVDPSDNGGYNNVDSGSTYTQVGSNWVVTAG